MGLIVGRVTQVVPGASLRAHVSLSSRKKPPLVEISSDSPQPVPPSATQEAAPSPPVTKDNPTGKAERYRDVLPVPLDGMFTGRAGRPETIERGKEPDAYAYKGGSQQERHPGS